MRAIRWSIRNAGGPIASGLPSSCNGRSFFPLTQRSRSETDAGRNPPMDAFTYAYMSSKGGLSVFYCSTQLLGPSSVTPMTRDGTPPSFSHALSGLRRDAHVPSRPSMSSTPTTRSRTLLFLSYRDSRASSSTSHHRYTLDNDGDENERLIDPAKDHIAIDVGLPPKWSGCLQR